MFGCVPPACGSFSPPQNRGKHPHFSTCMREFCHALSGSFGEILGGKPVRVFLCDRHVSSIHPSNALMRRCLLRWEYETPRRAFCRIWQRFPRGSFKDRFSGHLTTHCGIKCNSLAPKIARLLPGSDATLPSWIDREYWGWLTPEGVQQLMAKAGSEAQAQEKLDIILYNEAHGPAERRVRDRRAVLAHYLRTPHADIWPNDDGFETLALRRMRQEREQALQEKALAEEILRVRQEAAQARFLASLAETQLQWLKQEAKQRVDAQPSARFLTSRYPLYKAEESQLIHEWMDRVNYGESVPHAVPEKC